jgi:hypothetical protein
VRVNFAYHRSFYDGFAGTILPGRRSGIYRDFPLISYDLTILFQESINQGCGRIFWLSGNDQSFSLLHR